MDEKNISLLKYHFSRCFQLGFFEIRKLCKIFKKDAILSPEGIELVSFAVPEGSEGLLGVLVQVDNCVAADQTGCVSPLSSIVAGVVDDFLAAERWGLGKNDMFSYVQTKLTVVYLYYPQARKQGFLND